MRLISFLGLVCAALLFFSTCKSSNSGPSGPVSKFLTRRTLVAHLPRWLLVAGITAIRASPAFEEHNNQVTVQNLDVIGIGYEAAQSTADTARYSHLDAGMIRLD